jgi:hypothetical protein
VSSAARRPIQGHGASGAATIGELGRFCKGMGRDARQGEIGLVISDEYLAIRDFGEEER